MSLVNNNSFSVVPHVSKNFPIEQSHLYTQECLQARMQRVLKDSFRAQFQDYDHFHQYGMGDIVVLVGTSTAGKTSIIKALKQLEPDRVEDGGDLRGLAVNLKAMTKYNPNEIEILRNLMQKPLDIPTATSSRERSWKVGITDQEKMEAEEAIKRIKATGDAFSPEEKEDIDSLFRNMELEMFDDAFEHSRRGGNTIFDVLNIDLLARHLFTRNFNGPVRAVLTYCPFSELSSRMEKRNKEAVESGEFGNQRIGAFPLTQFSDIYTQKEKGQVALEQLTRKQVIQAFDENFDKGVEADRIEGCKVSSEEQLVIDKEKRRALFLAKLGFKEGVDVVEVAPKHQHIYNLVINSHELLPTESAKIIHSGTYGRY